MQLSETFSNCIDKSPPLSHMTCSPSNKSQEEVLKVHLAAAHLQILGGLGTLFCRGAGGRSVVSAAVCRSRSGGPLWPHFHVGEHCAVTQFPREMCSMAQLSLRMKTDRWVQ